MTEITLVRHGQANSHAADALSYDRLSAMGQQQAKWLGEYLHQTGRAFDHVVTGSLTRQSQTAQHMGFADHASDPRWDELDYFALTDAAKKQHKIPKPQGASEFVAHLPQVLKLWREDALLDVPESYADFSARVETALQDLQGKHGRILVVTSGGVIGAVMRFVLGLDIAAVTKIMVQVQNSSVHQLQYTHEQYMVCSFNQTAHLEHPDRHFARSYI